MNDSKTDDSHKNETINLLVQIAIAEYVRETTSIQGLQQKAGILLGFNGILVAILLEGYRAYSTWFVLFSIICFTLSAIAMCIALIPGKVGRFPLKEFCKYSVVDKEPITVAGDIIASYRNSLERTFILKLRLWMMNIGVILITVGIVILLIGTIYYYSRGGIHANVV